MSWTLPVGFVGRVVRRGVDVGLSVSTTIAPAGGSAMSIELGLLPNKESMSRYNYLQNNKDLNLRSQEVRPSREIPPGEINPCPYMGAGA